MKSQLDHLVEAVSHDRAGLELLLNTLKTAIIPAHAPDDGHKFQPDENYPAFCGVCGWIQPDTKDATSCGCTVAEHAQNMIANIEGILKVGNSGAGGVVIVIEVRSGSLLDWLFSDD
jgi:hypothetical protein